MSNYCTTDLRSFFDDADNARQALHISKPVDVRDEVASLCSQTMQPTLFHNLKGFEGFRLADGLSRTRTSQALVLGIEDRPEDVMSTYLKRLSKGPGPTVTLQNAPIKESIWTGTDANLNRLPIPVPSEGDDFPHLGLKAEDFRFPTISGGMGVTRHPDGTYNTFFTMAKVVGDQRIHFFMLPGHTAKNVMAWAEKGERCPMALVIGCHPIYELGAVYSGPHEGFSELNFVSSLLGGEPVPMIKAETLDLEVPAFAEIVIEGFIDPEKAPYLHASSHSDSYAPIISMEPFFDVTAITMRKNPIYRHIQPTRFTEHHSLAEFISIPPMLKMMWDKGLPVKDIHMPLRSCGNCAIIQMTANNPTEVREVMQTAMANPMVPRLSIVVDEDVDIYNTDDLLFALSIRTNGILDVEGFSGTRGLPEPLTILINGPEDIQSLPNNRWAIDATKPSLAEPNRRLENVRLRARGDGKVRLKDFI
jgi:2,5-furandicarboxylate decarboxylase 1